MNFSLEDFKPHWCSDDSPSTTSMLKQIENYQLKCKQLSKSGTKHLCDEDNSFKIKVDYIYHLNVGELVGTQTKERTKAVLECFIQDRHNNRVSEDLDQEERETINVYNAMEKFHEVRSEMDNTGMLTVQQICDVHKVLLTGLHCSAGKIRETEAFTHWDDGIHHYPSPKIAEELLYSVIDHHNMHMGCLDLIPEEEKTAYIFKCAAWLLFHFVDVHPFSDGNGRMCRLLANYVVSLITPFPVTVGVHQIDGNEESERKYYLQAIVNCRKDPTRGPKELVAMLVEGAWKGWKKLFDVFENVERD